MENNTVLKHNIKFNKNTDLSSKSASGQLLKRARSKYFTLGLMFGLIDVDSPLKKSYWNTCHCAENLKQEGNKISAKYCKNRWCLVCNRIKTAINIKKYGDEIKSWEDERYFVSLTLPNCKADVLSDTIDKMINDCVRILDIFKKRKIKFIGIRKLECTYNPERDDYHPHFHFIVKGKEQAEMLRTEWLRRNPGAEEFCQDVRQGSEGDAIELFKYFTKLITSKRTKDGAKAPAEYRRKIYIEALNNVFVAVRNRRTFQTFGFKGKAIEEITEETIEVTEICNSVQYWHWERELADWINIDTGECLTGYEPTEAMNKLLEGIKSDVHPVHPEVDLLGDSVGDSVGDPQLIIDNKIKFPQIFKPIEPEQIRRPGEPIRRRKFIRLE